MPRREFWALSDVAARDCWHITVVAEYSHYHGDEEITDYYELVREYDVPRGALEEQFRHLPLDRQHALDDLEMFLGMFPKP